MLPRAITGGDSDEVDRLIRKVYEQRTGRTAQLPFEDDDE